MDVEKVIAIAALLAGAFKATTSALKDIQNIKKERKNKKQSPNKEDR